MSTERTALWSGWTQLLHLLVQPVGKVTDHFRPQRQNERWGSDFHCGSLGCDHRKPVLSPVVDADHALALSGKSRVCPGAPSQMFLFFPAAPHSELSVAVLSVPKGSMSWWYWVGIDCKVPRDLPWWKERWKLDIFLTLLMACVSFWVEGSNLRTANSHLCNTCISDTEIALFTHRVCIYMLLELSARQRADFQGPSRSAFCLWRAQCQMFLWS